MEKHYTLKEASAIIGVHYVTLQKWDRAGKIKAVRTPTNRRRFPLSEIQRALGESENKKIVGYARVSSHTQKDDLERQIKVLQENGVDEVIKDIGSGLNENRKGFNKLIQSILNKEIKTIKIVYEDRLTRFGFKTFNQFANANGVIVEVIRQEDVKSPQEELTKDLITLIEHFSGKMYGFRSHKYKEVIDGTKQLLLN